VHLKVNRNSHVQYRARKSTSYVKDYYFTNNPLRQSLFRPLKAWVLKPLCPALPLSGILDAPSHFVRAVFQTGQSIGEAIADGFARGARRAGDGVAEATAKSARNATGSDHVSLIGGHMKVKWGKQVVGNRRNIPDCSCHTADCVL
jgi:hypothetical protein